MRRGFYLKTEQRCVVRLAGYKNFVGTVSERSLYSMRSLILSQCRDGCDKRRFRSFNHSTCKTVLKLLEAVYLRFRKIVVELQ